MVTEHPLVRTREPGEKGENRKWVPRPRAGAAGAGTPRGVAAPYVSLALLLLARRGARRPFTFQPSWERGPFRPAPDLGVQCSHEDERGW